MPAIGGPNITEDGLVFAYDLGNVRSYKGEPTTNILNDNILGHGAGASLGEDAVGKYIQLSHYTTSYSRFQLPSIPVSSNDTYTWSFEIMCLDDVTGGMSFDTNEYSEQYPNSNDLSRLTYTHQTPSSLTAGKWEKVSLTVTMKDGLTGAYTYDFFRFFYPTFTNKRVYYRNMQFEFKDHPTQYAGQGATRSNTEGLVDLINDTSVNLSNVSFDENAQMTFDGTDDTAYAIFDHGILKKDNQHGVWSIEAVFFYNGPSSNNECIIAGRQGHHSGLQIFGPTSRLYHAVKTNAGWTGAVNVWVDTLEIGKRYHTVMTYNNGRVESYLNGEHKATTVLDLNTYDMFDYSDTFHIGSISTRYNNIDLPVVKAYNKELSFEQVAQNYNSIKNRFNL